MTHIAEKKAKVRQPWVEERKKPMRVAVVLALMLGACTPYAQRVARTCESYGYDRGSPLFLQCVQGEEANDTAQRAAGGQMAAAGLYSLSRPTCYPAIGGYVCR